MRRIALAILLVLTTAVLAGCQARDWSDKLHPQVQNPVDYEP